MKISVLYMCMCVCVCVCVCYVLFIVNVSFRKSVEGQINPLPSRRAYLYVTEMENSSNIVQLYVYIVVSRDILLYEASSINH